MSILTFSDVWIFCFYICIEYATLRVHEPRYSGRATAFAAAWEPHTMRSMRFKIVIVNAIAGFLPA